MTSSRTPGTTPERAGREREKLAPAPKTPPEAEKEEPTNHAPGPQKLPRAKKKRKISRQSRSTDDDLPLPALCHLETVKKIQIKAADLEQQSIIHDRFTVGMMRLNILKIINYNSQQEETINGRLYVHSPSPLTELICLMQNSEMSMANHELQKVFLEDFHQRPGHAAISDVFLMKDSCLITYPVPVLIETSKECQKTLVDYSANLTIPAPDVASMVGKIPDHSLTPVYIDPVQGYQTDHPRHTVCQHRMLEMDVDRNRFLRLHRQIRSRVHAIDQIIGTNFDSEFRTFLKEECNLDEDKILRESASITDLEACGDKLINSRRTKREIRVKREVKLLSFNNDIKVGTGADTINKDFDIIRSNQDHLEMELSRIRTAQKVIYGVSLSLAGILEQEEALVKGTAVLLSMNRHIQARLSSYRAASDQIVLDGESLIVKMDTVIRHLHSQVQRNYLCQRDQCLQTNSTQFYQTEDQLVTVAVSDRITSNDAQMIRCLIDEHESLPKFNMAVITEINEDTVNVTKNDRINVYPKKCIKRPADCKLMRRVDESLLVHGVYVLQTNNVTTIQCLKKTVVTDRDPDSRTKICNLHPTTVTLPVHIPHSGETVGSDLYSSLSFLDLPDAVTLSRVNLLHHAMDLDMSQGPALSWIWQTTGKLREVIKVPSNHLFATLIGVLLVALLLLLSILLYCCRCCGLTRLLCNCFNCRSRTLTVERQEDGQPESGPPSRSWIRVFSRSCNCCRPGHRADSLDLTSLAHPAPAAANSATMAPAAAARASAAAIQHLHSSIKDLDMYLDGQPADAPADHPPSYSAPQELLLGQKNPV